MREQTKSLRPKNWSREVSTALVKKYFFRGGAFFYTWPIQAGFKIRVFGSGVPLER